jgi:hypothetical protein
VIRGNSGSGKSTIARQLQLLHGRGCSWVEQDYLRRVVRRERERPGAVAPMLVEATGRFALDQHYHMVRERILASAIYRPLIAALRQAHRGGTFLFYLLVSWREAYGWPGRAGRGGRLDALFSAAHCGLVWLCHGVRPGWVPWRGVAPERLCVSSRGLGWALVGGEVVVDEVGEAAFEGAAGFGGGLPSAILRR